MVPIVRNPTENIEAQQTSTVPEEENYYRHVGGGSPFPFSVNPIYSQLKLLQLWKIY